MRAKMAQRMAKAAAKNGIGIDRKHIFNIPISPETNDKVMTRIADKIYRLVKKEGVRIVGLFYCDFAKLKPLLEAKGLRLPDDVVLLGTSNKVAAEPGVAVIRYDWENMMKTAVDVLLQTIENPGRICGKYLVPCLDISDSFLHGKTKHTKR